MVYSKKVRGLLAFDVGEMAEDDGMIDAPLGQAIGSSSHIQQAVVVGGSAARTGYRVRERLSGFTLVELHPKTGRRHQIRVHLASIGHPIVGDKLYGRSKSDGAMVGRELLAVRHLLHAESIALSHPESGDLVRFDAPMPADILSFLAPLRSVTPPSSSGGC